MRRFYLITRDLHLYLGLFVSPFVLVFAASVFYLVHGGAGRPAPDPQDPPRTIANVDLPPNLAGLEGRPRVEALRTVFLRIDVQGEIDFVRHVPAEHRLIVPVRLPDRDSVVTLDYQARVATVRSRHHSMAAAFVYLHKMPGPHNADTRGNSPLIRGWRVLSDGTAYVLLFITLSGVYLWVALKAERRVGLWIAIAGAASFWGLVYVVAA
jgi:hypothetical protein